MQLEVRVQGKVLLFKLRALLFHFPPHFQMPSQKSIDDEGALKASLLVKGEEDGLDSDVQLTHKKMNITTTKWTVKTRRITMRGPVHIEKGEILKMSLHLCTYVILYCILAYCTILFYYHVRINFIHTMRNVYLSSIYSNTNVNCKL